MLAISRVMRPPRSSCDMPLNSSFSELGALCASVQAASKQAVAARQMLFILSLGEQWAQGLTHPAGRRGLTTAKKVSAPGQPGAGRRRSGPRQAFQSGLRLSMKACTPSSADSSIMLQAMVRLASV